MEVQSSAQVQVEMDDSLQKRMGLPSIELFAHRPGLLYPFKERIRETCQQKTRKNKRKTKCPRLAPFCLLSGSEQNAKMTEKINKTQSKTKQRSSPRDSFDIPKSRGDCRPAMASWWTFLTVSVSCSVGVSLNVPSAFDQQDLSIKRPRIVWGDHHPSTINNICRRFILILWVHRMFHRSNPL